MARIPDDLIERLKHEISLERLAEAKGVTLRQHGADLLGLCPFHDDHEPSLVITPSKNLWHCLGACQAGGTVIDWVMKAEGVSFRHAVEILRADFFPTLSLGAAKEGKSSLPLAASPGIPKRSTIRALPAPVELDADDEEIKRQVVGYYHETLKQSPEALAYLERRGLVSSDVVDHFKLGFSNRTLGLRLPLMNRKTGFEIRTRLQKLGLFRDSGHEHFVGSLVIPVFDEDGNVTEIYGRKIRDDLKPGTPLHLYLPGAHRGVFNVEALVASKEIILCEALIDALTFWCAGFRNVTSSYGVEGFTPDHLAAFKRHGTEHVLIAYDRDDAGNRAADALAKKLIVEGIACSRVLFPKGMDANEYALKVQPAAMSLGVLIRSAEWIGGTRPALLPLAALPPAPTTTKAANEEPAAKEENHSAPAATPAVELIGDDEAVFRFEDRRYRVRGLKRNMSFGVLKLNVLATREGDFFAPPSPISGTFLDTFDLASARSRTLFEKQAAHELGVKPETIKWDLGQVVRALEELQQKAIDEALKPKIAMPAMSDEERAEALEMLSAEDLVERILLDFTKCGIVGEETNKLLGYVAAVSRKLDRPLAVIIRSSSAAGKTALMEAILSLIPKEDREKYSALSEHSLFYFEGKDFKHKVLAIVEQEGAQRASYALKLLQSEGEITIASTGKDPGTGRLVTKEYRVEGPVMIFLVSTAVEIDEELLNRALVLTVDEGREQTRAIHRLQRESQTLEGLWAGEDREETYRRHHNAQRLLRPLHIVNPFVRELTFLDDRTRTRRDHTKYLTLIEAIALLHQYQRPVKADTRHGKTKEYIEATLSDVALANRLASEVLGRSLDELPPQTKRLLMLLDEMVSTESQRLKIERCDVRFSRRDVRAASGWGDTQVRLHLARLVDLEYVLVHRGGRGQSFVHELLYDGQGKAGEPFVIGLCDVEALGQASRNETTTSTSRGFEATSRGQRGPFAPLPRGDRGSTKPAPDAAFLPLAAESAEIAHQGATSKTYAQASRTDSNGKESSPRQLLMRRTTSGF